ncbi:hypothetical protein IMCC3135_32015 [Granulosicoccus antarcticus IMCC3135]|uniref:Uncharacterized protein n=1 Tax=Granulosicoccus antarcticus IMCC3135 TaxID=1192854 RepID=A0A2Z2P4R3_9GAMM|nr:hypothetical protein IMCC3135_32015 [Granulosicoccus antarcticus IMCC3135]
MCREDLLFKNLSGGYDVSNLLAVSAVKNFAKLIGLERRGIRVIKYTGTSKVDAEYDAQGALGYVMAFDNALQKIMTFIPHKEELVTGLRVEKFNIPKISVREILSNAIVHQDFSGADAGPIVEVFSDRIVITNCGSPLIETDRFVDAPSKSRNQQLSRLFLSVGLSELK